MAYCPDRYTGNRDKQLCFVTFTGSQWNVLSSAVQCCCTHMPGLTEDKSGCTILFALMFNVYSVCCQGYQQEENCSSLT